VNIAANFIRERSTVSGSGVDVLRVTSYGLLKIGSRIALDPFNAIYPESLAFRPKPT
jgi:hypothetical protein